MNLAQRPKRASVPRDWIFARRSRCHLGKCRRSIASPDYSRKAAKVYESWGIISELCQNDAQSGQNNLLANEKRRRLRL